MINEIEIKSSKSFSIIPSIVLTGIVVYFIYEQKSKLFDWEHFNPNGINSIIFLFFLALTTASWFFHFDNKPHYTITENGIWYRKNWFTRKVDCLAEWSSIEYFFIEEVNDRIYTEQLIIKLNDREKYLKITLTSMKILRQDILNILVDKSKEFNFQNLGVETNRFSKYK